MKPSRQPRSARRAFPAGALRRRSGQTLIELVMSTVILAIVLSGTVGAMVLASRAVNSTALTGPSESADVADQILGDLAVAQSVTERTDHAVTMTVPDRDGDGQPETIRYWWSGTPGDPLLRQYDGNTPVAIASNVDRFDLSYLLDTVQPGTGQTASQQNTQESTESLLMQFQPTAGGTLDTQNVDSLHAYAEYFKPDLPSGAVSWKITRVSIYAKSSSASWESQGWPSGNGVIAVQIRPADASGQPSSTVLAETDIDESSLTSAFGWVTVDIGPIASLGPDAGVFLVVQYVSGNGTAAEIEDQKSGSALPAGAGMYHTSSAGENWYANSQSNMLFAVYGTVSTPSP